MAYSQSDPRWAGNLLGFNTDPYYNLGNFGCLVTAVANLMTLNGDDTTPAVVNNQLKNNRDFAPGGGLMYWSGPPKLNPAMQDHGFNTNLAEVNQWLTAAPNFAILEVKNSAGGQHFVLGNLVNTMIDSADGRQKNILYYRFVRARLYTWLEPGKGSAAPVAVSTNGEPPMTPEQEANAYRIMLGRSDENPSSSPRTGYQFILDGEAELNAQRQQAAEQLAAANAVNSALQTEVNNLRAEVDGLKATATVTVPAPIVVTPTPTALNGLSEIPHAITRIAKADGEMVDYGEEGLPTLAVRAGMVFHQYSTFTAGGERQVRTQRSYDEKHWYGTPERLFDPVELPAPDLSKGDAIHIAGSKIVGWLMRPVYNLLNHKNK